MRRYKEVLGALISDMGGDPSEAKNIIARRSATLAVWCEQAEADMANGKAIDITPTLGAYLRSKGQVA